MPPPDLSYRVHWSESAPRLPYGPEVAIYFEGQRVGDPSRGDVIAHTAVGTPIAAGTPDRFQLEFLTTCGLERIPLVVERTSPDFIFDEQLYLAPVTPWRDVHVDVDYREVPGASEVTIGRSRLARGEGGLTRAGVRVGSCPEAAEVRFEATVMALPEGATNVLVDPLATRCYARHTVTYVADDSDVAPDASVERYGAAFVQPITGVELFLVPAPSTRSVESWRSSDRVTVLSDEACPRGRRR